MKVAILTGGYDEHYVASLACPLAAQEISLDIVGGSEHPAKITRQFPQIQFINIRKYGKRGGVAGQIFRWLSYYAALLRYAATSNAPVFHIVWNNKIEWFDRTLLMLFYKALGKKVLLTVHNVNAGQRDDNDSVLNRITLRMQYHLADRLFVHTDKMKQQLRSEFGVREQKVTWIPFGVNRAVPDTQLTAAQARQQLGLREDDRVILFYGAMRAYKGLKYLVEAFLPLAAKDSRYRLVLAGRPRKEDRDYLQSVVSLIDHDPNGDRVLRDLRFIPDEETEVYFKAADVAALPYTYIFQSGVLFLAYGFGLPVIVTDVGSMREDVVEGQTGFLCRPGEVEDLSRAIEAYFSSRLYETLPAARQRIRDWVEARHSWKTVGEITSGAYADLLDQHPRMQRRPTDAVLP